MKYRDARPLLAALQPYAEHITMSDHTEETVHIRAMGAITGMNHLKRCEWSVKDPSVKEDVEKYIKKFADVAEQGLPKLGAKFVSLTVNAIGHKQGYEKLMQIAAERCVCSLQFLCLFLHW